MVPSLANAKLNYFEISYCILNCNSGTIPRWSLNMQTVKKDHRNTSYLFIILYKHVLYLIFSDIPLHGHFTYETLV